MREVIDHRTILGPEPRMRQVDQDDAEKLSEPDVCEELVPQTVMRKVVRKPNKDEVERHTLTHMPYRAWCEVCVEGRGLSRKHVGRNPHEVREEPRIGKVCFDWAFFRDKEGTKLANILIGVDLMTSQRMAIRVENRLSNNA